MPPFQFTPDRLGFLTLALSAGLVTAPASAQQTAPSSITPPTLRPPPERDVPATTLPRSGGLTPPAGTGAVQVRIGRFDVQGGFPAIAAETDRIAATVTGRTVTLADLYAAASEIEVAHARAGYVLARVIVPPQQVADGGSFWIEVIDGFIESVDLSNVPQRVRGAVGKRVATLVRRPRLTLHQIERALVIAADVPGVTLSSALARGTEIGGTTLVLSARQRHLSGSVSIDNSLASPLGRSAVTAQFSLNSHLGLGEQIYGSAVTGVDPEGAFGENAPVTVLGGGVVLANGNGRVTLNPEVTFSRTQPYRITNVPLIRGKLRRLSLRGGFIIDRTRTRNLSVGATVEQIQEWNDAIDFGVGLSLDRFMVGRLGLNYSVAFAQAGGMAVAVQLSQGLGDLWALRPDELPFGVLPSRQGAKLDFTKASLSARVVKGIAHGIDLNVVAKAQTSFGKAVFRSEQTSLEGPDALSAYIGGITAVDAAVTARVEVSRQFAVAGKPGSLQLLPYGFAATGKGWVERPSAVETSHTDAANLGAGIRAVIAATGLTFGVEYARGFSDRPVLNDVDRLSLSASLRF